MAQKHCEMVVGHTNAHYRRTNTGKIVFIKPHARYCGNQPTTKVEGKRYCTVHAEQLRKEN